MTLPDKRDRIDHEGRKLVWRQVADDILADIGSGVLPPGSRLPAEFDLADQYGVSRVTIRRAIQELRETGVVEVTHGRGTFVCERGDDD